MSQSTHLESVISNKYSRQPSKIFCRRVNSIDRIITSVQKTQPGSDAYDNRSINFGEMTGSVMMATHDTEMEMTTAGDQSFRLNVEHNYNKSQMMSNDIRSQKEL